MRRLHEIQERRDYLEGAAGLVQVRVARQTGRLVAVYDGMPAGMDTSYGRWQTVCEDHGTIICHRSKSLAIQHAADPQGWCEECRAEQEGRS